MKKTIMASISVSIFGTTFSCFGQGRVFFDNYFSTPYYAVVYGSNVGQSLGTTQVSGNVDVELGYYLGNLSPGNYNLITLIPSSVTAINPSLSAPNNGIGPSITGYFDGGVVAIPGYVSGPVTFEILGWIASGYGAGDGTFYTSEAAGLLMWTEPSISSGAQPGFFTALPGSLVIDSLDPLPPIPEPATLRLFALGVIGFWRLRRLIT